MSDIQRREIERGLIDAGAVSADPNAEPTHCCTIVSQDAAGSQVWIQALTGSVNMMYPFEQEPLEKLRVSSVRSPLGMELIEWQPTAFATFAVSTVTVGELAFFLEQLFTRVLGCDEADYETQIMIETLDP